MARTQGLSDSGAWPGFSARRSSCYVPAVTAKGLEAYNVVAVIRSEVIVLPQRRRCPRPPAGPSKTPKASFCITTQTRCCRPLHEGNVVALWPSWCSVTNVSQCLTRYQPCCLAGRELRAATVPTVLHEAQLCQQVRWPLDQPGKYMADTTFQDASMSKQQS